MRPKATSGKLPGWGVFENHHLWLDDDGKPKARQVLLYLEKTLC